MNKSPKSTVIAIIRKYSNDNDYILLTQRKVEPYQEKWCLPGGHIDNNEMALQAIKREVKEETGLEFFPNFYDYFDEIIPEKEIHAVVLIFVGDSTGNLQKNNEEVKDAKWVLIPDAIKYNLAFQHEKIIKKYMKQKKKKKNGILHELNYLRREIENRFETRSKMLYYTFILAGIILAFGKIEGYLFFPIIGTVLAGLWSHSDIRIKEIGTYVREQIEPNVHGINWENYLFDKYKKEELKDRKRQETYVIGLFFTTYLIMLLLTIISVFPNISKICNNEIFPWKDILILTSGITITILCMIKTRVDIKKSRKTFD
jgi:8-oxo-dGTP diphosphatase